MQGRMEPRLSTLVVHAYIWAGHSARELTLSATFQLKWTQMENTSRRTTVLTDLPTSQESKGLNIQLASICYLKWSCRSSEVVSDWCYRCLSRCFWKQRSIWVSTEPPSPPVDTESDWMVRLPTSPSSTEVEPTEADKRSTRHDCHTRHSEVKTADTQWRHSLHTHRQTRVTRQGPYTVATTTTHSNDPL